MPLIKAGPGQSQGNLSSRTLSQNQTSRHWLTTKTACVSRVIFTLYFLILDCSFLYVILFIYLLLLAVLGLHCCVGFLFSSASRGGSSGQWAGFSFQWLLLLLNTGSVVVADGLSCSKASGIFLDQGLNPCLLHWHAEFLLLNHQGSPAWLISILCDFLNCNSVACSKRTITGTELPSYIKTKWATIFWVCESRKGMMPKKYET